MLCQLINSLNLYVVLTTIILQKKCKSWWDVCFLKLCKVSVYPLILLPSKELHISAHDFALKNYVWFFVWAMLKYGIEKRWSIIRLPELKLTVRKSFFLNVSEPLCVIMNTLAPDVTGASVKICLNKILTENLSQNVNLSDSNMVANTCLIFQI